MIVNEIFAKRQTIVVYTVKELTKMLDDQRLVLREVNAGQARMIRRYILDNVIQEQIYLPPIVAAIESGSLADGRPDSLIIIDGSQRMKALTQLESAVSRMTSSDDVAEQKKGFTLHYMLNQIEVAVQVFEGLSPKEMDQLYIDLNTKGKKVSLSKRISYDSRNEVNSLTNRLLKSHQLLRKAGVELEKAAVMRPRNTNLVSLSQLRRLVGYFMTGKVVSGKIAMHSESTGEVEETYELLMTWFDELFNLHDAKTIGDYKVSMLASYSVLSALTQYAYSGVENETYAVKQQTIQERMRKLSHVNWSPKQDVWKKFDGDERGKDKFYYLKHDKKTNQALIDWLRLEGGE